MSTEQLMDALEIATERDKVRFFNAGSRGEALPTGLKITTTVEGPGEVLSYKLAGRISKRDEYTVKVTLTHNTAQHSTAQHMTTLAPSPLLCSDCLLL
jgi:hypothetical protein